MKLTDQSLVITLHRTRAIRSPPQLSVLLFGEGEVYSSQAAPKAKLECLTILEQHPRRSARDQLLDLGGISKGELAKAHVAVVQVPEAHPPALAPLEPHVEAVSGS
jgi:hypothetical protein